MELAAAGTPCSEEAGTIARSWGAGSAGASTASAKIARHQFEAGGGYSSSVFATALETVFASAPGSKVSVAVPRQTI